MFLFNEIFAERYEEQDAQYATQQRTDEHLHEVNRHFGIFLLKNIKGGQGKDGSRYDNSRTSSDGLNHYVFAQCAFALGGARYAYRDDGDRDGGFEHLSYLQS